MKRKRILLLAALVALLLLAVDLSRAPAAQWSAAAAVAGIHGYQRALAPLLGRAGLQCRFVPTCSHYAEVSIRRHGFLSGSWRAAKRIARCGPWTARGSTDLP